jgi:methionine sulfoxide reductase heme-binding subunit
MSLAYRAIDWNRQKRWYDLVLGALLFLGLVAFAGILLWRSPEGTAETLVIRGTAMAALTLLHVILCIGPLARLDRRFLPVLYNRRHLGVTLFLLALIHAAFAVVQFHALGDENPLVSVFTAYRRDYRPILAGQINVAHLPFEPFGAGALAILFLMAATSHDFWLRHLGAVFWKTLHLGVYAAYGLLLVHVGFGLLQAERSSVLPAMLGLGFVVVCGLHLASARKEHRTDVVRDRAERDGFVDVAGVAELREGRGTICTIHGRRIAVWRHEGRVFATANVCRHQGGPLGEGRILDGCITCPWHGWNYRPADGCSPPPFHEVIATHETRVIDGRVWVRTAPNPLETLCEGSVVA